jgi:hypothetical protein
MEHGRVLVPKQHSTGGKAKLLGITKRGNPSNQETCTCRRSLLASARAEKTRHQFVTKTEPFQGVFAE